MNPFLHEDEGADRAVLTIGTMVIGVNDIPRAIDFWTQALRYKKRDDQADPT